MVNQLLPKSLSNLILSNLDLWKTWIRSYTSVSLLAKNFFVSGFNLACQRGKPLNDSFPFSIKIFSFFDGVFSIDIMAQCIRGTRDQQTRVTMKTPHMCGLYILILARKHRQRWAGCLLFICSCLFGAEGANGLNLLSSDGKKVQIVARR